MNIVVHGHWGPPMILFPTSGGDERESEGQSMIGALAHHIDGGRVKVFCINTVNNESWYDKRAHPRHRSYVQAMYDAYVAFEVVPFIHDNCRTQGIPITTTGASFGAYHAANTLFKYPDIVKRCFALSGVYDMKGFMNGAYDENLYFNNPVDYLANASDPWMLGHLATCDIHIATGSGPWEQSGESYRLSQVLASRGISHHLDDWGPLGGHDWPYWKHQMQEYLQNS